MFGLEDEGGKRRGCGEANVEDEGRLTGGWQL